MQWSIYTLWYWYFESKGSEYFFHHWQIQMYDKKKIPPTFNDLITDFSFITSSDNVNLRSTKNFDV